MAFTVDHAKRMRAAVPAARRQARRPDRPSVDLLRPRPRRHELPQARTDGQDHRDRSATCTAIRRTAKPQWSRPVYPDMTPENILWKSSWARRRSVPFDANRYINWRFFWDYSGGNVYENMCHQLSFWYKVMDLKIPQVGDHDRRHLPLEGRPRSSRHHERLDGACRRRCCSPGTPASATTSWRHRRRARRQRHRQPHAAEHPYSPQKVNRATATK